MFLKIKNCLEADKIFLLSDNVSFWLKTRYILDKYLSIVLNRKKIRYYDFNFEYDSRLTPLILQFYPVEISYLNKNINLSKINRILDIGANVGQWAYTIKSIYPHINMISFEPNKIAFNKLKKNASNFNDWIVFNHAVGRRSQKKTFYYPENSTLSGSFIKNNANEFDKNVKLKKTKVSVVNLNNSYLKKIKIPNRYDLVKIDVEGSELEVLESLTDLSFEFLVVEVPMKGERNVSIDQVNEIIKDKFKKKSKIICTSPVGNLGYVADVVYKLT